MTKILPYNSRVKRVRLVPLPPPATISSNPRIVYVYIIIIVIIFHYDTYDFSLKSFNLGISEEKRQFMNMDVAEVCSF